MPKIPTDEEYEKIQQAKKRKPYIDPPRKWKCCECGAIHHYFPSDMKCRNPVCGCLKTLVEITR